MDFAVMEFVIGITIGLVVGVIYLKWDFNRKGQGSLKMCKSCDYLLDSKKRKAVEDDA